MNSIKRVAAVLSAAAMSLVLAVPAATANSATMSDVNLGQLNSPYNVASTCQAVLGVSDDFNVITYAVEAEAAASSTETAVGVGTAVVCEIVDVDTGEVYGSVEGGLPGPSAIAADTVTIPTGVVVYPRVCGAAVYSDGGSFSNC